MFRARTLFVIGAGASAEVDLPVGAKLLEEIVKLVDLRFDIGRQVSGDGHVFEALRIAVKARGEDKVIPYTEAAGQLVASAGQALSIDNVIDALEDERVELVWANSVSFAQFTKLSDRAGYAHLTASNLYSPTRRHFGKYC